MRGSRLLVGFLFLVLLPAMAWANMLNVFTPQPLVDWTVDLGLEERLRWEYRSNYDFNDIADDEGSIFYNRLRASIGLNYQKDLELFVEGLEGSVWNHEYPNPQTLRAAQRDAFDLHQAYIKVKNLMGSGIDVKAGRQEVTLGKGRLIACPAWANRINAFDMLVVSRGGPWSWVAFGGSLVAYDDNNPNESNDNAWAAGIYGGIQADKEAPRFEPYYIGQFDNRESLNGVHVERHTIGLRSTFSWSDLQFDVEVPYQFGENGTADISAYAFHFDVAKTFKEAPMKPCARLEFNLASGDDDPNDTTQETFVPLYQSTHGPYGITDLIRWQNMREIAMSVALEAIEKKLIITPGFNFFWLDNKNDYWYNAGGVAQTGRGRGNADAFFGSEISLVASYKINANLNLEGGWGHFFTGDFIETTPGGSDDVDWIYSQLNAKF